MIDILKITVIFIAMLALIRLKWNIGYVMSIASALLFLLYAVPLSSILSTTKTAVTDPVSVKLFFALTLIRVFEIILREKQVLARMTEATKDMLRRKKAVIVSMPMLIGLLPSLGGAYFSAPMVEESTKDLDMSAEEKGFINYWFRHPWEFILPLYPGILLASAITKVELRSLILANMLYALLIVITGFLFGLKRIGGRYGKDMEVSGGEGDAETERKDSIGARALWSFLPVLLILFLVIVLRIELHYALGAVVLFLFLFYRFGPGEMFRVLRHGFTKDVFVLIFGTMLFRFAMESSGAVAQLNRFFSDSGIPLLPVLFTLPFISGLLTGLTVGFVGSTFPLIISLAGGAHLNQLSFAFASGFIGVLLSPVHLCLVLTREYFKAEAWGMYKQVIKGCGVIMIAALAEYLVL